MKIVKNIVIALVAMGIIGLASGCSFNCDDLQKVGDEIKALLDSVPSVKTKAEMIKIKDKFKEQCDKISGTTLKCKFKNDKTEKDHDLIQYKKQCEQSVESIEALIKNITP